MKYSESNKPLVCMMTQSTCYKGTSKMAVKGVLWHSTGANNPNLKRYVQPDDNAPNKEELLELIGINKYKNDMNHIDRQMGMNCWIGKLADGSVTTIQTIPWNWRPWGCGSGPKGSCNNGWIQFEICEDGLTDKAYFEKVYNEACEITAYLCDMFDIDPHGTVMMNGVAVPTILCHKDSCTLGFGSNHGDVLHWFPKFGKDMDDVRNDVAALLPKKVDPPKEEEVIKPIVDQIYRIREAWDKPNSQKGAYRSLESAKAICDTLDGKYKVFDGQGKIVYPEPKVENTTSTHAFKIGDEVALVKNAKYTTGKNIPQWVINSKLYIRQLLKDNKYVISTKKTGEITGSVEEKYLTLYKNPTPTETIEPVTPFLIRVNTAVLNVRATPDATAKITAQVKKNQVYTIVAKKGEQWGKLKSGAGWIDLNYVKKV